MHNKSIIENWSSENVLEYYSTHRDSVECLYESEKKFLPEILQNAENILDIGCAAGGFLRVVKAYNDTISYTGVDIAPAMIKMAKRRFPEESFYVTDGEQLVFPDEAFDAVICFGVLHMVIQWKRLLAEAWRVCRGGLLLDLRVTEGVGIADPSISYQKLEFGGIWDGVSRAPYIVVNIEELMSFLFSLYPSVNRIKSYGYLHSVSPATVSPFKETCMSVFFLSKKSVKAGDGDRILEWGLPLPSRSVFSS